MRFSRPQCPKCGGWFPAHGLDHDFPVDCHLCGHSLSYPELERALAKRITFERVETSEFHD